MRAVIFDEKFTIPIKISRSNRFCILIFLAIYFMKFLYEFQIVRKPNRKIIKTGGFESPGVFEMKLDFRIFFSRL